MTHYSHIPMVRILAPFISGVIAWTYIEFYIPLLYSISILALIFLSGYLVRRYFLGTFHYSYTYGIYIFFLFLIAGYLLAQSRYELKRPDHFSHFNPEGSTLRIRLIEPVSEKTNSFQIVGRVTHLAGQDTLVRVRGKIILWIQKDSLVQQLRYGDVIITEAIYQETRAPQNPHAFNYKHFLARQNIFHQSYRRSGEWFHTGMNEGNPIVSLAHAMRQKALETLEANNIKGRDFAVASALLLGFREYLDDDLQREFAGAGAMHILCVSGLHVGIIFMALNVIFGFLSRLPAGRFIKTGTIITLIWFYAAITGFAPSVMRASTMFSFVALGQSFSRNTNIYNTLSASAIALILIDPFIISRIGFQLSYIAVISIVSLQPLFYKQLFFKNKILDHIWGIVTVSLAAQLGTGPLALYYFNQFPNYFLLTNIIVIPLTGVILKGGILLFLTAAVPLISQYVGIVLSWVVLVLHTSVRIIEGLPGSTANDLVIAFHDKIMIFALIALGGLLWSYQSKKLIMPVMAAVFLLVLSFTVQSLQNQNRNQLIVYQVPNATALDIISQGECFFYGCESIRSNPRTIAFHLRENRLRSGIKPRKTIDINENPPEKILYTSNFISYNGHTIAIFDKNKRVAEEIPFPHTISLVLVRDNPRISMESIMNTFPEVPVVFDSSNNLRNHRNWLQQCDSLGLNCWSVSLQGAFVMGLN